MKSVYRTPQTPRALAVAPKLTWWQRLLAWWRPPMPTLWKAEVHVNPDLTYGVSIFDATGPLRGHVATLDESALLELERRLEAREEATVWCPLHAHYFAVPSGLEESLAASCKRESMRKLESLMRKIEIEALERQQAEAARVADEQKTQASREAAEDKTARIARLRKLEGELDELARLRAEVEEERARIRTELLAKGVTLLAWGVDALAKRFSSR